MPENTEYLVQSYVCKGLLTEEFNVTGKIHKFSLHYIYQKTKHSQETIQQILFIDIEYNKHLSNDNLRILHYNPQVNSIEKV